MPALLLLALLSASLLAPLPAEAGLIPCGLTVDDPALAGDQTVRCTLCHLVVGVSSIVSFLRNLMFAIAIAVIVAMAFIYITSSGDEGRMRFAKGGIIAALVGFAVILLAWVTVNFVLTLPVFSNAGLVRTGWSSFSCNATSASLLATTPMHPGSGGAGNGGGQGGQGSGETVTIPRDGAGVPITLPVALPVALSVSNPTASTLDLAWAAGGSPVSGYEVERCVGVACSTFASLGTTTSLSFGDTQLSAGTSYSYRVRSISEAGVSPWSGIASGTTLGSVPTVPNGLAANATSATSVRLNWIAPNGRVTSYEVERCAGVACTLFAPIGTASITTYSDTGLLADTYYHYRVRAVNGDGTRSDWSGIAGVTTLRASGGSAEDDGDIVGGGSGGGGTPPNGTCVGPGTPQYLLGKSWVSNRINPDGTPIRTEVSFVGSAANNNLGMNLTIICQMSALGHGNDLSPGVTVLIQNATASTFDIVPNYEQTLTNNRGYTCTVRTVTETATYTPLSDTTMRLFGLDFTGTCMGSSAP